MIRARNLRLRRGGRWLVDGISLDVLPGQVLALVGPNGAGKSTLLTLLSGEAAPDAGTVGREDGALPRPPDWARFRAVLPQGTPRAPGLGVREVLTLGRLPHRNHSSRRQDSEAVARVEAQTGLKALGLRSFDSLSGGEAQRAAFARGLVQLEGVEGQRYFFLDEPTSALDLSGQFALLARLRSLADQGTGVVCVIHDLNLAARLADRIAVVHRGRLAALGPPAEVLTESLVEQVFATRSRIVSHPVLGHPLVLALESLTE